MSLTLKVLSFKGQPAPQSAVIIDSQGTIGRSDNNTLVLPDPERFVSRQHATISMENGLYYLTDCSLSGVFIDEQTQALHDGTVQLLDGMSLRIGEYEIAVSIDNPQAAQEFPFANTEPSDYFLPLDNVGENRLLSEQSSTFVKHQDLIQASDDAFTPSFESQLQGGSSVLFDSFIAPAVSTNPFAVEEIPEGFSFEDLLAESQHPHSPAAVSLDELMASESTPQPIVEMNKVKQATPEPPSSELFDAFLQGVGIEYRVSRPEQLTNIMVRVGQMFRHLIIGTVAVLRTRTAFKSLFRIDMTLIQATDNNPLKFAISTDDLIRQFLDNKTDGFLGSVEAIDQSFNDMVHHQQAIQAGIQAAVAELLKSFDPKLIEKQIEQGIVLQKKAKCWDKYEEIYRRAATEAMEDFFTDAFAEAYEQKIRTLIEKRHHR